MDTIHSCDGTAQSAAFGNIHLGAGHGQICGDVGVDHKELNTGICEGVVTHIALRLDDGEFLNALGQFTKTAVGIDPIDHSGSHCFVLGSASPAGAHGKISDIEAVRDGVKVVFDDLQGVSLIDNSHIAVDGRIKAGIRCIVQHLEDGKTGVVSQCDIQRSTFSHIQCLELDHGVTVKGKVEP